MPSPDRNRRLTTFLVAIAVLIVAPLAVVASDAFTDVSDDNVHHDDITWLADNGITAGCNPPDNTEFCPDDPVLRQQMASFMRRLAENEVVDAATANEADHAATANDAQTLDGKAPDAFLHADTITTSVDGSNWQAHQFENFTDIGRFVNQTRFSGSGATMMPLVAPLEIGGASYGLQSFSLCFETSNTEIQAVEVWRSLDFPAELDTVLADDTIRSKAEGGCDTFEVEARIGDSLAVYVVIDGSGSTDMGPVKTTWSTEAAAAEDDSVSPSSPSNALPES